MFRFQRTQTGGERPPWRLASACVRFDQDTDADKDYTGHNAKQSGFRSLLAAPLLKGDQAIGSIVIYKAEPGTFPPQQIACSKPSPTRP